MTEAATKRRAIADKLAADIARLKKEIADRRAHLAQAKARALAKPHKCRLTAGWFDAWSRHAPPIAKAEGALARALKRLPQAQAKATVAQAQEAKASAIRATIRARNIGLMRRLDALRDGAADVDAKWKADRAGEEKRLDKMRKKLELRTRRDLNAKPDWMTIPSTLPPPVRQPVMTEADDVEAPPPREGLIPGTYRVLDPSRFALLDAEPLPPTWTARHVGTRLIEAHDVLSRLPMSIWPKGYGAMWPAYSHDAGELAIQAGAGTLELGRNAVLKCASSVEVARMNESLQWAIQYLSHCNAWSLGALNYWASLPDADPDAKDAPTDLLEFIAAALNAAKEVVR